MHSVSGRISCAPRNASNSAPCTSSFNMKGGGRPPLRERSSTATVGTVIETRRITDLPLNGRNYLQLIALSPNVNAGFSAPGQASNRQGGSRSSQNFSIMGQRGTFNRYTLDGIENTDVNFNLYVMLPSVDSLQEFKVQTGVYPAEAEQEQARAVST